MAVPAWALTLVVALAITWISAVLVALATSAAGRRRSTRAPDQG